MANLNGLKKSLMAINIILLLLFFFTYPHNLLGQQHNNPNIETINNLSLTETNGKDLTWKLLADHAIINKKEHLIHLKSLILVYHLSSGENIKLTGDNGVANLSHKQISIHGNIIAKSEHGIDLKTETLIWDAAGNTITTPNSIEITQSDIKFSGIGLHADLALKEIKIIKGVKTVIY